MPNFLRGFSIRNKIKRKRVPADSNPFVDHISEAEPYIAYLSAGTNVPRAAELGEGRGRPFVIEGGPALFQQALSAEAGHQPLSPEEEVQQRVYENDQCLREEQRRRQEDQLQHEWLERESVEKAKEIQRLTVRKQQSEADQKDMKRKENASKDSIRRARHLIRKKYQFDIWIWHKRNVQKADREVILADCRRADEFLQELLSIVTVWEEDLFSKEEWKVVKKIKEGLGQPNQYAVWGDLAPWDRDPGEKRT